LGVFAGAITIAAGAEVAYLGFCIHIGQGAVSMIIYSSWVGILGVSAKKSNVKEDNCNLKVKINY
jgi:hypothetical protein